MAKLKVTLLFICGLSFARSHLAFNHLHPVHSLYVKPSNDGITGDLYVAATEDHGVKSQWLTDQPVNFLPSQHASPVAYSSALTTTHLPHDETIVTNQKRAVITSPAVKYAYALPGTDGAIPYPYTVASTPAVTSSDVTECSDATSSVYPYPFNVYYAQMMAAFANALNSVKESSSEDATSAPVAAAPVWPSYSYPSYPVQYVMVDPSAWAKAQTTTPAQPTTTPAPAETSEEIA